MINYFEYLNKLRDSGVINMFEAPKYLVQEFGLTLQEAKNIVTEWMTEGQHREH